MVWTSELVRAFAGGCAIGAVVVLFLAITICTYIFEKEEKFYQEKYTALFNERNQLFRQNKKLIDFIKNKKWEYDHET